MTAPDPLFLLQYLQLKDSRLYDFLKFLLRKVDSLQYQLNNLPAPAAAAVASGSALGGSFNVNFGGTPDTTLSGTVVDARITGTEYIVCGLGPPGAGHSGEDYTLEEIHISVDSVSAGQFAYTVHAPNATTSRIQVYWIGVA